MLSHKKSQHGDEEENEQDAKKGQQEWNYYWSQINLLPQRRVNEGQAQLSDDGQGPRSEVQQGVTGDEVDRKEEPASAPRGMGYNNFGQIDPRLQPGGREALVNNRIAYPAAPLAGSKLDAPHEQSAYRNAPHGLQHRGNLPGVLHDARRPVPNYAMTSDSPTVTGTQPTHRDARDRLGREAQAQTSVASMAPPAGNNYVPSLGPRRQWSAEMMRRHTLGEDWEVTGRALSRTPYQCQQRLYYLRRRARGGNGLH